MPDTEISCGRRPSFSLELPFKSEGIFPKDPSSHHLLHLSQAELGQWVLVREGGLTHNSHLLWIVKEGPRVQAFDLIYWVNLGCQPAQGLRLVGCLKWRAPCSTIWGSPFRFSPFFCLLFWSGSWEIITQSESTFPVCWGSKHGVPQPGLSGPVGLRLPATGNWPMVIRGRSREEEPETFPISHPGRLQERWLVGSWSHGLGEYHSFNRMTKTASFPHGSRM